MASRPSEPIAVIGMSCRFPAGANDPEKLWSLLADGKSAWQDVPSDRFDWKSFYHPCPDINGTTNHRGGHFLDQDIATFDASFFGIPPSEAHAIDPQQRIQLETAYEALENAGIPSDQLRGSNTAVFVATFSSDYDRILYRDLSNIPKYHMTGTGSAIASNRISYLFDFKGPSMTLDTGCSGSLVALHQACQNLRSGESNMALVGGTNLILSPDSMVPMSLLHILNEDGRCYSFDSRGSGYGRGEGVATIVLKRLGDAMQARDPVRAIIRGIGVNQDGKTSGITLPSQQSQENLIRSVYSQAGLDPRQTDYIEAHGTGTVAGDVTELKSITNCFCTDRKTSLHIGSIKSNIGHLESTSGLAGLIKSILVLEKGFIPPSANFEVMKQECIRGDGKVKIAQTLVPWPDTHRETRYASVNSFGYGGTNAHVILQAAPLDSITSMRTSGISALKLNNGCIPPGDGRQESMDVCHVVEDSRNIDSEVHSATQGEHLQIMDGTPLKSQRKHSPQVLVLTAKSKPSLLNMSANLAEWAKDRSGKSADIRSLSYTLSSRRSLMPWRCSIVADCCKDLALLESVSKRAEKAATKIDVTFLFTGQGAQWYAMGRDLIFSRSGFRDSMYRSCKILTDLGAPWNLVEELLRGKDTTRIQQSDIAQPSTTAIQIALVDLFRHLGIVPSSVLGHSSGEIAAAYAAGALTQAGALRISFERGNLFKGVRKSKGAMLAVGLGEEDAAKQIADFSEGTICIACINGPNSTTISGDEDTIVQLKSSLDDQSVFNRRLDVGVAYHSPHMQEVAGEYLSSLRGVEHTDTSASVRFYSTVTAAENLSDFAPPYWVQNLVSKVRYKDALETLCHTLGLSGHPQGETATHALIELGPHSALSGPTSDTLKMLHPGPSKHAYVPTLVNGESALHSVLRLAGRLFELGHGVDLETVNALDGNLQPRCVVRDLAPYPWDHSSKYWHESHLSRDHRLRKHPYHDLIGHPVGSDISYGRHWRHIISIDNLPWLRDHVIDNIVTFPGAGYLCMAIHGILQLNEDHGAPAIVDEIILRDIVFSKALSFPDLSAKTEIRLSLVPSSTRTNRAATSWQDFSVSSLSEYSTRNDHCRGSIMIKSTSSVERDQEIQEQSITATEQKSNFERIREQCTQSIDSQTMYDELRSNGNTFGSSFAILEDVHMGDLQVVGNVVIPDVAAVMPSGFMQPHIIHPTSLDALLHITVPLLLHHSKLGSIMPVSLKRVVVSANIRHKAGDRLLVAAKATPEGRRAAMADIFAFKCEDQGKIAPVVTISQEEIYATGSATRDDSLFQPSRNTTYQMKWGPDVDFLSTSTSIIANSECLFEDGVMPPEQKNSLLERATSSYIRRCLDQIGANTSIVAENHMLRLLRWMQSYLSSTSCHASPKSESTTDSEGVLWSTSDLGVEGEALSRVGDSLTSILTGNVDPLSLLLEGGLLHRLYHDDSSLQCSAHLSQFVKNLIFKSPYITVLEIGAGTAGTTLPLLQSLDKSKSFIRRYDYTDISFGFFESARSKLSHWSDLLHFMTLDIERDPIKQGFDESSYDLIIASNVLHATKSISETLLNVRKLLKPGGRLALIEVTRLVPMYNIIFGLLPGWWRGFDDGRQDYPLLSVDEWHKALSCNSFSGVDIAAKDFEGPASKTTMMTSRATDGKQSSTPASIEILSRSTIGPLGQALSVDLTNTFEKQGLQVKATSWSSLHPSKDSIYVVLDSSERPLLVNMDEENFHQAITLTSQGKNVLWISLQETISEIRQAEGGLVTGFARTARSENEGLELVTLDVQHCIGLNTSKLAKTIYDVINVSFGMSERHERPEVEFAYHEDELLIPRLIPDANISSYMEIASGNTKTELSRFHQPNRPLKLSVRSPGLLDSLVFIDDEVTTGPLGENEIEIRVMACGINFKDVFVALGQMKGSTQMAGECAGIVTTVGCNMQTRFQPGDRVCAWNGMPYASQARVNGNAAYRLPESISFTIGASIPVVFSTAYYSLVEVAKLQKEHAILIHAASGGVGQAAIMIAKHIGARIFATAGSEAKRQFVAEKYTIPQSNVFSSLSSVFKKGIMRLTKQRGVNVVLNSLSGAALEESWECIAKFGTFVEIGKTDIYRKTQISMEPFDLNTTFTSVDMVAVADHLPERMHSILATIMSLFEDETLQAVEPVTVRPLAEIESAFRDIQARRHTGKVVLEAGNEAEVTTVCSLPTPICLDESATYIVSGGLGSIGQSICKLMAKRGAKHIVILSRRTLGTDEQRTIEKDLASQGAKVYIVPCDITDFGKVQKLAVWCQGELPPVKGIVQAAMVLEDCALEQMTIAGFKIALDPKVDGTKHLITAFESTDLSFFIMLASGAGLIGSKAQGNYVAASSFQDAVAHSKSHLGTNYLSLDIGMVDDTNTIAQHGERRKNLMRGGLIPLKLQDVLTLVEYAMSSRAWQDRKKQLAIGFGRRSLDAEENSSLLRNNLFNHLTHGVNKSTTGQVKDDAISIDKAIETAANIDEVFSVVAGAIIKQLSALVAIEPEAVSLDSPMGDLGLDSLIAIELKNWILRALQAAVQTSDVVDATNLRQLLTKVMQRSDLVSTYQQSQSHNDVNDEGKKSSSQGFTNYQAPVTASDQLSANPLPSLQDTLDLYYYSVRAFLDEDSRQRTLSAIEDFKNPKGLGAELQNRLAQRASDAQIDNWLYDLYSASRYLRIRAPTNPYTHFFGSHIEGESPHSQAERAAIVSAAALHLKQDLENGHIKPDRLNDQNLCMTSLHWLFNSTREPHVGLDQMRRYPGNDYLVALRHGRFYKIKLTNEPRSSKYARLREIFQNILTMEGDSAPSIASLTADDRDRWAKVRKTVQDLNSSNHALVETIEKAAFLVALDDGSPNNPSERTNQYLLGDPSSRWSDKVLQFVICENGASAYVCEHGGVDGGTLAQLGQYVNRAISEHRTESRDNTTASQLISDCGQVEEYIFTTNAEIEDNIRRVEQQFWFTHPPVEYVRYICRSFGGQFLRARKCAPNAGYSLAVQLASLQYFGFFTPCTETVSLRIFHKGRVDILQTVLPPVAEFCIAMLDPAVTTDARRDLFYEAVKAHSKTLTRIGRGRGFGAHLRALREVVRDDEEVPLLFRDPGYTKLTKPENIRSSCMPLHDIYQEAGVVMPEPVEITVNYDVRNESCRVSIQGPVGKTARFFSLVEAAADEIKRLLEKA